MITTRPLMKLRIKAPAIAGMRSSIAGLSWAVILRPGKTPDGAEVALILRHVVKVRGPHCRAGIA
jgi:hypothetical protein